MGATAQARNASCRLTSKLLLPLTRRDNRHAALHAVGHLGAIALSTLLLWQSLGTPWVMLAMPLQGFLLAFLFNALHETAHQTAFRSRVCNCALGHLAGFTVLLPYGYYRAFHWDHHRYTQDRDKDPELAKPLPSSRWRLAWYVGGVPVWLDRIRMLLVHGVLGRVVEPWVPPDKRSEIINEARAYVLGYGLIVALSIVTGSWVVLWLWWLPVAVGQWFLRPYLLAEHTGCAHSNDMLENTRTTYTNAWLRFFAWNMPYHAEHHAYPAVPFHALPKLNALLAARIVNTERGYPASVAAVVRHLSTTLAREANS